MNGVKSVFKKYDPYPLIVNFQNGTLREGEYDIDGGLYSNTKNNKRTAVMALNNMLYIGDEIHDDNSYNIVVTRSKKTGEIRLIEVGSVHVKALSEYEQNLLDSARQLEKPVDNTDGKRNELGEAFGSKRRKRLLEQYKKLKVNIDTMKEQLEKTVNEKQIDNNEVSQLNAEPVINLQEYIPQRNKDADNIADVYNLNDLIPQKQMEALKETANNVFETEKFDEYIEVTSYVKDHIIALKASKDDNKVDQCCILLYADCILRYIKDPYAKIRSQKYVVCEYSETTNKCILDSFSLPSDKGRTRPPLLKDRAICHAVLLLLLCNKYSLNDAVSLSKLISTPLPRLTQLCKVIGAYCIGDAKKSSIVFKLPLAEPPTLNRKRVSK